MLNIEAHKPSGATIETRVLEIDFKILPLHIYKTLTFVNHKTGEDMELMSSIPSTTPWIFQSIVEDNITCKPLQRSLSTLQKRKH